MCYYQSLCLNNSSSAKGFMEQVFLKLNVAASFCLWEVSKIVRTEYIYQLNFEHC